MDPTAKLYSGQLLTAMQRELADLIAAKAQAAEINPAFMLALAVTESSLRDGVIGDDGVSVGLFQLQLRTARAWREVGLQELLNPSVNAEIAMLEMRFVHQQFPGHRWGDYAEAWTLGASGRFVAGKRNERKWHAMERAVRDLSLVLNLEEVWP